ncbi:MAG TPA: DUF2905 family protein [Burkholderiales bacterium]|nr:DUF2905 family protein [Burkholderiales bacterium]
MACRARPRPSARRYPDRAQGVGFYFPLASCILVSLVIMLLFRIFRR